MRSLDFARDDGEGHFRGIVYKTLFQIGDDKGSVTGENITYDDLGFEGIESKASTTGIQTVI